MRKTITEAQGSMLLRAARCAIGLSFGGSEQSPDLDDAVFAEHRGTFVTLTLDGKLRGCIGNIEPVRSLAQGVYHNARAAAFQDSRFAPLTAEEFARIHIAISILSRAEPLQFEDPLQVYDLLRVGVDGVILSCGGRSATFLPQVWEQLPDIEQFLRHLSVKAGLSADDWRSEDVKIATYQVQSFSEEAVPE